MSLECDQMEDLGKLQSLIRGEVAGDELGRVVRAGLRMRGQVCAFWGRAPVRGRVVGSVGVKAGRSRLPAADTQISVMGSPGSLLLSAASPAWARVFVLSVTPVSFSPVFSSAT